MAKTGRSPKPAGRAQGHRRHEPTTNLVALPAPEKRKAPPVPKGSAWSPELRRRWRKYWTSDVSIVAGENVPQVVRLWNLYHRLEKASEAGDAAIMTRGSTGQLRINPAIDLELKLEPLILRLETEVGLTPLARLRLGIAVGQAAKTLEEMNADVDRKLATHVADEDDPRLRAAAAVPVEPATDPRPAGRAVDRGKSGPRGG